MAKSKKTHRFNVFDFILIVLVVIVITVTVVQFVRTNPNKISGGDKVATYEITTVALPEALRDQIKIDDLIYDTESSQLLGKVTDIQSAPYTLSGTNELDGSTVTTEVEGKITLTITVTASVWLEEGTYNIDGYRISVGKAMSVRTNNIVVNGECTKFNVSENAA